MLSTWSRVVSPAILLVICLGLAITPISYAYAPPAADSRNAPPPEGPPPLPEPPLPPYPTDPTPRPPNPGPVVKPVDNVPQVRVAVFIYHEVRPGGDGGQYVVTPERLRGDLEFLLSRGWRALDYDTLAAWYRGAVKLQGRHFLLTFDDGYEMAARHCLPVLAELEVPAVLFLTTGRLDAPGGISSEAARALAESGLVSLQSHTHGLHYQSGSGLRPKAAVELVSPEEMAADFERCNEIIAGLGGGERPDALAWPYGTHTPQAVEVARQYHSLLFGTQEGLVKPGGRGPIPRFGLDWRGAEAARRLLGSL